MAEPIKVVIKDETGQQEVSVGTGSTQSELNKNTIKNTQVKSNQRSTEIAAAGTFIAMQTANYVTSNIGKWSGRQQTQTTINNAKRVAGYGMALAANVWLGLAVIAVDGATSIADYMYDRKWEQIRSNQAKARNGDLGGYRR